MIKYSLRNREKFLSKMILQQDASAWCYPICFLFSPSLDFLFCYSIKGNYHLTMANLL